MIGLIILDLFIYNLTSFNVPTFLIGIPYNKIKYLIIYFLILIIFKWQYIFLLGMTIFLYIMDYYLCKIIYFKYIKIVCILLNYIVYLLFTLI